MAAHNSFRTWERSPHSQSFPTSAFRRRVTSQSALRDHPSSSSFNTDLDSRMGMKRNPTSDDSDQRVQFRQVHRAQKQVLALIKSARSLARYRRRFRDIIQPSHSPEWAGASARTASRPARALRCRHPALRSQSQDPVDGDGRGCRSPSHTSDEELAATYFRYTVRAPESRIPWCCCRHRGCERCRRCGARFGCLRFIPCENLSPY